MKLLLLTALVTGMAAPAIPRRQSNQDARKPNVVFILGDDLGYCDVSMYGCREIPTPNIDSIAAAGVKFTNGYVTAPVCSPSRAGLMTGRYQHRFGFEFNAGPLQRALAEPEMGLPTSEVTLAEVMKKAGYATGMVGKWHLGLHDKFHPTKRGFDEYFGFLFGANMYIDPEQPGVKSSDPEGVGVRIRSARNPIMRGQTPVEENDYLTEAFTREAVAFIERHRNEAFFLYAPFNAPHTPLQATQKYYDRFPQIKDERRRIYAAMVSALDTAVGAILKKLRDTGLEKDTLVVFLSDNGCATYTNACTNDPLRLGKLTHFEGGYRVPFALQLPGKIKAGTVYQQPVSSLDLFPTAVALADGKLPTDRAYDGVDLLPYLTGKKKTAPHEVLCWRNGENAAVRKGNWKLFKGGEQYWLYDLSKDIGEQQNVADKYPVIVAQLKKELADWEARMKPPMWPCRKLGEQFPVVIEGVKLNLCI
ncbi:MAG: sulfatase-like hydrolase/transferase [Acidobacteria bacterium]|nr:sulfatase-like hydrolase/transferase [Acidobacteriota bacterium]